MVASNRFNMLILYKLVKKNYNSSTIVVVDDVVDNFIESLYNYILIKDNDFESLPKYLEASEYWFQILKEIGFSIATDSLRNSYIVEMLSYSQEDSEVYFKLKI